MHTILFDQETEDKIIGNKYTGRQGIYLAIMFIYPSWMFFTDANFSIPMIIFKVVTSIVIMLYCYKFAFHKISIYYYDYYLIKKYKYIRKNKIAVYRKF
jgi:hypothetical protein